MAYWFEYIENQLKKRKGHAAFRAKKCISRERERPSSAQIQLLREEMRGLRLLNKCAILIAQNSDRCTYSNSGLSSQNPIS